MTAVTVPNVLATRYAGADLAAIWSPEHKIVLERQLWIGVVIALIAFPLFLVLSKLGFNTSEH